LSCHYPAPSAPFSFSTASPPSTFRRCVIFSSDGDNAAKAHALGFEHGRPYYIVNGTRVSQDIEKDQKRHDYSFQASLPTPSALRVLILLQLAAQPNGACIALQPAARQVDIDMFLHVVDPFTDQPQQRSAVQFIVDLLCQADKLESDFLFVNYHQDIIVGLFESLFKAAMTNEFFDDIVRSNSVQTVLKLLLRRVSAPSRGPPCSINLTRLCSCALRVPPPLPQQSAPRSSKCCRRKERKGTQLAQELDAQDEWRAAIVMCGYAFVTL
jgi:hypothetical protein